jgi:ATPase subunit of ABC transporter with duplicated ATPase domains
VLDEPDDHLDFVGAAALQNVLSAWTGGLVVASHDPEFLRAIGVEQRLELSRFEFIPSTSSQPGRSRIWKPNRRRKRRAPWF